MIVRIIIKGNGMMVEKLGMMRPIVLCAFAAFGCMTIASAEGEITSAQMKSLYGRDLQILGELQSINLSAQSLVVAGQHVALAKETTFTYNGAVIADHTAALHMLHAGDVLAITGAVDEPAVSISRIEDSYVPGATRIFIKGKVASVISSVGRASVGELGVDFTPAMADPKFTKVEVGQVIEATGVQPTVGGLLLADSVSADSIIGTSGSKPTLASIIGTSGAKPTPDSIIGTSGSKPTPASIIGTSGAKPTPDSIIGTSGAKPTPASIIGTSGAKPTPASIIGTSGAKPTPASIIGTSGAKPTPASIIGTSGG
jgi:hypothetical protein